SAGVPRSAASGKDVIGANHLVSVRNIGLGPQEQRSVIRQTIQEEPRVPGENLDMLARDLVRDDYGLFIGIDEDDPAEVAPGSAGELGSLEDRQLTDDFLLCRLGDRP